MGAAGTDGLAYRVRAGATQVWEQQELIGLAYRVRAGATQVWASL